MKYLKIIGSVTKNELYISKTKITDKYLEKDLVKFIPASGAATRMFEHLYKYIETEEETELVKEFFDNIEKFALYKFRTMIPNAEKETGPVLATSEDKRITKLGKFLRASRIDELPQLLNIIKGDMSIVGPRPERDFFIKQFTQENNEYPHRLKVKAGVTGLAQALGTYNTNFNDKLRFDIYYITNYSFFSDINILLQTVMSIIDPDSSKGLSEERTIEEELNNKKYQLLNAQDIYIKKIV